MSPTAANRIERVLPPQSGLRQWVLTFPFPWRRRLAQDGALLGKLTRIFVETVHAFYAKYVQYHKGDPIPWQGLYWLYSKSALVNVGRPQTIAHEVAHLIGVRVGDEEYGSGNCPGFPNGSNPCEGYYVDTGARAVPETSRCFMGCGSPDWPNLGRDGQTPKVWIDSDDWSALFQRLLPGAQDPEVLVVSAILRRDKQTDLREWYALPGGQADTAIPGDPGVEIRVLDVSGQMLANYTQPVTFEVDADPFGVFPTDSVPLVVRVEFPKTAAWVELLRKGTVVARVSPASKVLRDNIQAIPAAGFDKNPEQRRKALLNKVDAVEKQLAEGSYTGALNKLTNDLRKQAENWLIDGYPTTSPLETTKQQLLQVIDMMIERVSNMMAA